MKIVPNIGKPMRIGYVVIGLALIAVPLAMAWPGWQVIALSVLGAVWIATGATGW